MHAGIIFLAVIIGSVLFHIFTPWWWTDIASNWGAMDDTINLTFWIGGGVFVLVCLFMVYCVLKYSYKEGRKVEYKPEDHKLEKILTIATTIGVIALLAPGLFVYNNYINTPKNALNIEVNAWQWGWMYRLPGQDGILGTAKVININDDNPFGINLDDPKGLDDILIEGDDLHILKDQAVKVNLRSIDVLHNFYIPQFRAKMDMLPGIITYYWFIPEKTGEYESLCAEYCGTGHYAMRGYVKVDEEKDYSNWLAKQISYEKMLAKNSGEKLIVAESKN